MGIDEDFFNIFFFVVFMFDLCGVDYENVDRMANLGSSKFYVFGKVYGFLYIFD